MILYSNREIWVFLNSLQQVPYPPSNSTAYGVTIYLSLRVIEAELFQGVLTSSKLINFRKLKRGGIFYVVADPWASVSEIKELYDIIFRLEFERVPTIIHDFPEVAKWRLGIGK